MSTLKCIMTSGFSKWEPRSS